MDDIEFADHSPTTEKYSERYVTHPNSYLPVYQSISDVNGGGSDGGFSGSQWISSGDVNSTTKSRSEVSSMDNTSLTAVSVIKGRKPDPSNSSTYSLIRNNEKGFDATSDAGSAAACDLESTFV